MATTANHPNFSGSAKVWQDFSISLAGQIDDDSAIEDVSPSDEFRDEYVRLPYDDVPHNQECHW